MTSVSTGMRRSSGCDSVIDSYLMGVELVAAISIVAVALAALLAAQRICIHHFGDALVAAEELGHVGGEIDEHVPTPRAGRLIDADQHRLERRALELTTHVLMRDEAALRKRPQELIELPRLVIGRRVDIDVMVELRRLVDDFASELQSSIVGVAVEDVEVDLRHCPSRFNR